ncbi:MAG: HVO_2922 family protein [Haloarculaceae archaeon]
MSGNEDDADVMVRWYRERIAVPTTNDEVYGYWVFVFGILLGIFGILLYLSSYAGAGPGSLPGEAGIGLAAVALILLMIGPVIRLPLRRTATLTCYAGALVAFVGVVWFFLEYPGWRASGMASPIITLYAFGLVLIAVGAALVPVIHTRVIPPEGEGLEDDVVAPEPEPETTQESSARFELYEDRGGKWRWRLRHRNGNIVADGGQGYSSRQKARQGLKSVKRNAAGAEVIEQEPEDEEPEEPADAPYPPGESQGTFDVYEDRAGQYRWRLVHENGNIIADSGEGYSDLDEAEAAVERVQGYVTDADYLGIDPAAFEVYRDAADEWRWRLLHRNGEILADCGQGYSGRTSAQDGIESVRRLVDDEDAVEVYEDEAGEYRWRLVAENGEVVADGGEGFATERGARESIARVREYAPEADALDYTDAAFELYEDNAGEYRWRLLHENGRIMGDSGEGYASRTGAIRGIRSVKRNAPNAERDLPDDGDEDESEGEGEDGERG